MLSAMLRKGAHWRDVLLEGGNRQGWGAFGGTGFKKALFIGFNRFFILHMGVKRSTIRVSTLKEMK